MCGKSSVPLEILSVFLHSTTRRTIETCFVLRFWGLAVLPGTPQIQQVLSYMGSIGTQVRLAYQLIKTQ